MFQDPTSRLTFVFSDSLSHDGQPPGMEVRQQLGRLRLKNLGAAGDSVFLPWKTHTFGSFACGLSAMTSSWPELKRVAAAGVFPLSKFPKKSNPASNWAVSHISTKKWIQQTSKQVCTKLCILYDTILNIMCMQFNTCTYFSSNLELLKMKRRR